MKEGGDNTENQRFKQGYEAGWGRGGFAKIKDI